MHPFPGPCWISLPGDALLVLRVLLYLYVDVRVCPYVLTIS